MLRVVEPEWLDELPPDDPKAIASRRDLRRLNYLMGHVGTMQKSLQQLFPAGPKRIIEIGAGDGTFMQKLAAEWNHTEIILVDRQPAVSPGKFQVVQADVFDWLPQAPKADCIIANLFLHHFQPDALAQLLGLLSRITGVFIAGEPRRCQLGMAASRSLGLIGCNEVTRHDATISVRAGFCGQELSGLWPDRSWQLQERRAGLFSHWFVAQKK